MKIPLRNTKNGGETQNCHESVPTLSLVMVAKTYDYGNGVAFSPVATANVAWLIDCEEKSLSHGCFFSKRWVSESYYRWYKFDI